VTAELRRGGQVTAAQLDEPLVLGDAGPMPVPAHCGSCGVVQAIHPVEMPGQPGYFGAVAGSLVGALIGGQVGRGDGRTAARILGALGGAYAGHEIERASRQRTRYDIVVRMDDGGFQTRGYDAVPPFHVGDRVRVAQDGFLRQAEVDPR
jgi:outer membrane lipoprotein SlyB